MKNFSLTKAAFLASGAIAFMLCLALAKPARAATLVLDPSSDTVRVNDQVEVGVYVDSKGENLNALSGSLLYSSDLLSVVRVSVADSLINFWAIDPSDPAVQSPGSISWSGISPGGWRGLRSPFYEGAHPGLLFEITFKALKAGNPTLAFDDLDARQNDGKGTPASVSSEALSLEIAPSSSDNASDEKNSTDATIPIQGIVIAIAVLGVLLLAVRNSLHEKKI